MAKLKPQSFKGVIFIVISILVVFGVMLKVLNLSPLYIYDLFGETYSTNNIKEYRNFDNHFSGEHSGRYNDLVVFPEKISSTAEKIKYLYVASNKNIFDNDYQIFLQYKLSDDEYKQELERISTLGLQYDTENYNLPAYEKKIAASNGHEYILVNDKTNEIIYVYTQFVNKHDIRFDKKYLSKDFTF